MKKSSRKTHGGPRVGSGRKPTGRDPVRTFRLSDDFITKLDAWRGNLSRSEAVRRLVEMALQARS